MKKITAIAMVVLFVGAANALAVTSIQNPSFETVPSGATGQGLMPSNWQSLPEVTPPGADTYSDDGSYGLTPGAFGNFPGVTAFDGKRWVAGWSLGTGTPEAFGQQMTGPLTANRLYELTARLIMPQRSDIANPGTYRVSLASDLNRTNEMTVGTLQPPGNQTGTWTPASVNWSTVGMNQAQANLYTHIIFTPVPFAGGNQSLSSFDGDSFEVLHTYAGLDNLVLNEDVPEPATMSILAIGGLAALIRRRKR